MLEKDMQALGARMLLVDRAHWTVRAVTVLTDDQAIALAGAYLLAQERLGVHA